MALACEMPQGLWRKCGKPATGICRWCGRPYCREHQSTAPNAISVCRSQACVVKAAFVTTAGSARQRAQAHNREGYCGLPTCGIRLPGANCRICGAEYCPEHLSARLFRVVDPPKKEGGEANQANKKVRFFVCDQCIGVVERYGIVELPVISLD